MGLLDFLSTKPANDNSGQGGLVVSPSSAAQSTPTPVDPPQVQKNYKDLQYPMPVANNNQLGSTVLPQAGSLQPKLTYATETLPPIATPQAEIATPHVETILDNGVRQVTHSSDAAATKQDPNSLQNTSQALYSYSNNPVPADILVEQAELNNPVVAEEPPSVEVPPVENAPIQSTNNVLDSNVGSNPIQSTVPGVTVSEPSAQVPAEIPAADESKNGDIIEIGSAAENPVSDESQEKVNKEIPETQPSVEQTAPVEIPAVEIPQPANIMAETVPPVVTAEISEPVKTEIVPTVPEAATIADSNKIESEATSLNVLNKVAFISLNTQSVNSSLSQKVKSLAEILKSMNTEIYIDSNKGYGMDVISGLSGTTGKVTAAYLKPFFSKYSDETTLDVPITNLTRITFSTVLDRIKFLYKEATVFVVPETSGLNSLSQVLLLLNSQAMYFGTHKPVILFGTAWKERINTLKSSFSLTQQEMDSMYFASTPDEVITLLKKLDSEFTEKKVEKGSVIDMRDEQGEKEGLLAS